MIDTDPPARVVICDDTSQLRELVRLLVDSHDSLTVVGEAGDGVDGLDVCKREQPDVLLLDIAMPRMDGLTMLGHLRDVSPNTRVVVYTGFASADLRHQALELGAVEFLEKGIEPATLLDAVARAAGR